MSPKTQNHFVAFDATFWSETTGDGQESLSYSVDNANNDDAK